MKRDEGVAMLIAERLAMEPASVYWCPSCESWWVAHVEKYPISSRMDEVAEWTCEPCDLKVGGPKSRAYVRQLT